MRGFTCLTFEAAANNAPFRAIFHAYVFRFHLVWFRLSCEHGWIRSGSVNVRYTTTTLQVSYLQPFISPKTLFPLTRGCSRRSSFVLIFSLNAM